MNVELEFEGKGICTQSTVSQRFETSSHLKSTFVTEAEFINMKGIEVYGFSGGKRVKLGMLRECKIEIEQVIYNKERMI